MSWFRTTLALLVGLGQAPLPVSALPVSAMPVAIATPSPERPSPESIAARIDAALAAGELAAAASLIERSTAVLSPPRLLLARGEYALAAGEFEVARTSFRQLTNDPALAARAQLGIGLVELHQDHTEAAIAALDAATAADPSSTRAWTARAVAADRERDWARADTAYARALALEPRSAAALTNRGYSKLLRGRFTEAASDLETALAVDPKLTAAVNDLRLARAMQGDYKRAFAGSTKLSMATDLNTVGFAAMSRGEYGLAETFFTRAMQLNPQFDRTAWDNLVYLKQLAHKPPEPVANAR